MNDLICLYAPKESGKTTVADILEDLGYVPIAFADPVRDGVAAAFGLDRDWFREVSSNQATKEVPLDVLGGRTPREVLVQFGMFFRDEVAHDHWATVAVRRIQALRDSGAPVVVTDCRFENEAQAVQSIGGIVVGICRPATWRANGDLDRAEAAVYSGWKRVVDTVLVNNGDLEELKEAFTTQARTTFTDDRRPAHEQPLFHGFARGDWVRLRHGGTVVQLMSNQDDEGYFHGRYQRTEVVQGARSPSRAVTEHTGTFHRSELAARFPHLPAVPEDDSFLDLPGFA